MIFKGLASPFKHGKINKVSLLNHFMGETFFLYQIVQLDGIPDHVDLTLIEQGLNITINGMSGTPLVKEATIVDPLQSTNYGIDCPSYDGETIGTTIYFRWPRSKIFFDSVGINH